MLMCGADTAFGTMDSSVLFDDGNRWVSCQATGPGGTGIPSQFVGTAPLDARMTRGADMQMCAFVSSHRLRK
jgi:hypothetical protein